MSVLDDGELSVLLRSKWCPGVCVGPQPVWGFQSREETAAAVAAGNVKTGHYIDRAIRASGNNNS